MSNYVYKHPILDSVATDATKLPPLKANQGLRLREFDPRTNPTDEISIYPPTITTLYFETADDKANLLIVNLPDGAKFVPAPDGRRLILDFTATVPIQSVEMPFMDDIVVRNRAKALSLTISGGCDLETTDIRLSATACLLVGTADKFPAIRLVGYEVRYDNCHLKPLAATV